MTTIAEVRDALANCVDTISGLRAQAYEVDGITPPIAHVVPLDYDPRVVLGEVSAVYPFQIRVYLARAAVEQNQAILDTYREISGSHSMVAAIQNLANWGGVDIDYVSVTRVGAVGERIVTGVAYLGIEIDLEVCW